jgi:hypothetical protein
MNPKERLKWIRNLKLPWPKMVGLFLLLALIVAVVGLAVGTVSVKSFGILVSALIGAMINLGLISTKKDKDDED